MLQEAFRLHENNLDRYFVEGIFQAHAEKEDDFKLDGKEQRVYKNSAWLAFLEILKDWKIKLSLEEELRL